MQQRVNEEQTKEVQRKLWAAPAARHTAALRSSSIAFCLLLLMPTPLPPTAPQILEVVQSTPSLSRISLVGNSLGGLYVRYAAKLLYRDETAGGDGRTGATVAGLSPSVFMTIATPHLGVRRFTYVPLPSPLHSLAGVFVGKTGHDLFLSRKKDGGGEVGGEAAAAAAVAAAKDSRENSLLYNMATTEDFLRPLKAFRWRRAYANRRGDFMVPYGTAAFIEPDEGDGSEASPSGRDGAETGEEEQNVSESDVVSRGASSPPDGATAALAAGTGSFTFADRLLGAKNAAIVGVSRVSTAGSAAAARSDSDPGAGGSGPTAATTEPPADGAASEGTPDRAGAAKNEEVHARKSMEEEMAAGLNSCGWEKVRLKYVGFLG